MNDGESRRDSKGNAGRALSVHGLVRESWMRKKLRDVSPYLAAMIVVIIALLLAGELGVLLFLVIMGGVLAYVGDQLGIYWGKKRLSIMGMRPKRTAMLISIITGFVITFLTLFTASYLNENFQIAMFETNRLLEEQKRLIAANEKLGRAIESLKKARNDLEAERKALEKKIDSLEQSYLKLKEDIARKIGEIARLNKIIENKETTLMVIGKGEVLSPNPLVLASSADEKEVRRILVSALHEVVDNVRKLGAETSYEKLSLHLDDMVKEVLEVLASGRRRNDSSSDTPYVFQLVSPKNISLGEELLHPILEHHPNYLIARKGEEIARTFLDPSLPREKQLDQLLYFKKQVTELLRGKGASERSLHEMEQLHADELNGFFSILKEIEQWRRGSGEGRCIVKFIAQENIRAFSPVRGRYELEIRSEREDGASVTTSGGSTTESSGAIQQVTSSILPESMTTPLMTGRKLMGDEGGDPAGK